MPNPTFEWDVNKDIANQDKHGVSFAKSTQAFEDPLRLIISDKKHSTHGERRFFCIGKVGRRVLTVRFTYRDGAIRIFGAGYWREGKERYEAERG